MQTADAQIADILAKYGEPLAGNIWRVSGTAVIYHKCLERIAAQAQIAFEAPSVLRAERDEAVILVTGRLGTNGSARTEWSIGEALINVNYRVSGKQAAYPYAMAEKRAKDRVILKLIELHGLVYSEEEADEFKQGRPSQAEETETAKADRVAAEVGKSAGRQGQAYLDEDRRDARVADEVNAAAHDITVTNMKRKIKAMLSINAVTDLMLNPDTQRRLGDLPEGLRDEVRAYAKDRLIALGWPSKKQESAAAGKLAAEDAGSAGPQSTSDQPPASGGLDEDGVVSLDSLLIDLTERLGHAHTLEDLEEAYDDFGGDALFEGYEDGVEKARATKDGHEERIAQKSPQKPQEAREPSGAIDQLSDAERPSTASAGDPLMAPIKTGMSLEGYRAWLAGATAHVVDRATAQKMLKLWYDTAAQRDAFGLNQQQRDEMKWMVVPLLRSHGVLK